MKSKKFPNMLLFLGALLIILGILLLLWTLGFVPSSSALWPVVLILIGLFFLYKVFLKSGPEGYIFPGMFFTLGGSFFLLMNTIIPEKSLMQIWPVFMFIIGLSMLSYGIKQNRNKRIILIIPSTAIMLLSLVFLPFSLRLIQERFIVIVTKWWPVLFITVGISLIVAYLYRLNYKDRGED